MVKGRFKTFEIYPIPLWNEYVSEVLKEDVSETSLRHTKHTKDFFSRPCCFIIFINDVLDGGTENIPGAYKQRMKDLWNLYLLVYSPFSRK